MPKYSLNLVFVFGTWGPSVTCTTWPGVSAPLASNVRARAKMRYGTLNPVPEQRQSRQATIRREGDQRVIVLGAFARRIVRDVHRIAPGDAAVDAGHHENARDTAAL